MKASAGKIDEDKRGDFIFLLFAVLLCCLLAAFMLWIKPTRPAKRIPSFSVMLTDVGSFDPLYSPVIHPVFDLTLRVDDSMDTRMCREKATVTVSYGGMILGWGDVEDFCVEKRESTEVMVALSHADVVLTDELRRSMALEMREGELEVSVELRMLFPKGYECDDCAPQTLLHCCVRPGQGYSPCHCHAFRS